MARSWIINFVENVASRAELLGMMAEWWEFTEADRLRVGLLDELPPKPDVAPDASLADAFASFLSVAEPHAQSPHGEGSAVSSPQHMPPPRAKAAATPSEAPRSLSSRTAGPGRSTPPPRTPTTATVGAFGYAAGAGSG